MSSGSIGRIGCRSLQTFIKFDRVVVWLRDSYETSMIPQHHTVEPNLAATFLLQIGLKFGDSYALLLRFKSSSLRDKMSILAQIAVKPLALIPSILTDPCFEPEQVIVLTTRMMEHVKRDINDLDRCDHVLPFAPWNYQGTIAKANELLHELIGFANYYDSWVYQKNSKYEQMMKIIQFIGMPLSIYRGIIFTCSKLDVGDEWYIDQDMLRALSVEFHHLVKFYLDQLPLP